MNRKYNIYDFNTNEFAVEEITILDELGYYYLLK